VWGGPVGGAELAGEPHAADESHARTTGYTGYISWKSQISSPDFHKISCGIGLKSYIDILDIC
jgi:hypothetical protein